jgi:hypothetical protein
VARESTLRRAASVMRTEAVPVCRLILFRTPLVVRLAGLAWAT